MCAHEVGTGYPETVSKELKHEVCSAAKRNVIPNDEMTQDASGRMSKYTAVQ